MPYSYKKENIICFDTEELRSLFAISGKKKIMDAIIASGYTQEDIEKESSIREELADNARGTMKKKEYQEIFVSLFIFARFYGVDAKVCFKLNDSVNVSKNPIDSLEDLTTLLKEGDIIDFSFFLPKKGFVNIQLKTYHLKLDVDIFYKKVKEILFHYGNDIGDTNLLFLIQTPDADIPENFFEELSEKVKKIPIKGTGHILVSYNELDKFDVINTVHPFLGTTRIPHKRDF